MSSTLAWAGRGVSACLVSAETLGTGRWHFCLNDFFRGPLLQHFFFFKEMYLFLFFDEYGFVAACMSVYQMFAVHWETDPLELELKKIE